MDLLPPFLKFLEQEGEQVGACLVKKIQLLVGNIAREADKQRIEGIL